MRDASTHLVISRIPRDIAGLFQAGVINYHQQLPRLFGESLFSRYPVGIMTIVYDLSPEQFDVSNKHFQAQLGLEAATYLASYCNDIRRELGELGGSTHFTIGFEDRLALTKRHDDADIVLTSGSGPGEPTKVVEVAKDPSVIHPFRQTEVIGQINQQLSGITINQYDIQCINNIYRVKTKRDWFFQGKVKGSPGQYSQGFIVWVVTRWSQDGEFFQKTRAWSKSNVNV